MSESWSSPELASWRRALYAAGTTSLVLGLVLLVWPGETLLVFAALLGIGLVLLGIARMATAIGPKSLPDGRSRVWRMIVGLVYVIAGIVVLGDLNASLLFLVRLTGILWLVSGAVEVVVGLTRRSGERTLPVVVGLANLVGGIVLLAWPEATLLVLIWVAGIWLVLLGLLQLYFGWRVGRAGRGPAQPGLTARAA
jgi:uncharacterized membrane protein HdeD (DUF308 family)